MGKSHDVFAGATRHAKDNLHAAYRHDQRLVHLTRPSEADLAELAHGIRRELVGHLGGIGVGRRANSRGSRLGQPDESLRSPVRCVPPRLLQLAAIALVRLLLRHLRLALPVGGDVVTRDGPIGRQLVDHSFPVVLDEMGHDVEAYRQAIGNLPHLVRGEDVGAAEEDCARGGFLGVGVSVVSLVFLRVRMGNYPAALRRHLLANLRLVQPDLVELVEEDDPLADGEVLHPRPGFFGADAHVFLGVESVLGEPRRREGTLHVRLGNVRLRDPGLDLLPGAVGDPLP